MAIYLDHSSTTRVHHAVLSAMRPFFSDIYGNPSSAHQHGKRARQAVEEAREKVAALIGAEPGEIFFTSGGTEADNLAVLGTAACHASKGKYIVTSAIEHPAVLNACRSLEARGFRIRCLSTDKAGRVNPEDLKKAIRKNTILISIMHGNNEIGTIQPVRNLGAIAKEHNIPFHTDCVQSVGKIPVRVADIHCDLLSLSAHKMYGPKGIGALFVRKGMKVAPVSFGGGQQNGLRSGTENVAAIVGFGKACELAAAQLAERARIQALRDLLQDKLTQLIPDIDVNGPADDTERLPHILSVSFNGVKADVLLRALDREGISVSAGAACHTGSQDISHVLTAIGLTHEQAMGTIRFSLGKDNTRKEMVDCAVITSNIVNKLRMLSELEQSAGSGRCV